jgi:hypothetical protein
MKVISLVASARYKSYDSESQKKKQDYYGVQKWKIHDFQLLKIGKELFWQVRQQGVVVQTAESE